MNPMLQLRVVGTVDQIICIKINQEVRARWSKERGREKHTDRQVDIKGEMRRQSVSDLTFSEWKIMT